MKTRLASATATTLTAIASQALLETFSTHAFRREWMEVHLNGQMVYHCGDCLLAIAVLIHTNPQIASVLLGQMLGISLVLELFCRLRWRYPFRIAYRVHARSRSASLRAFMLVCSRASCVACASSLAHIASPRATTINKTFPEPSAWQQWHCTDVCISSRRVQTTHPDEPGQLFRAGACMAQAKACTLQPDIDCTSRPS